MTRPPDHPAILSSRIGVLLVNLGTPDAPDTRSVRQYLKEFLSDRRVVELPPILWQPLLRGVVLNTRPRQSAHAYRQIWTDAGSPLAAITKAQADQLKGALGDGVVVEYAMRYGNPAIPARIKAMQAAGCDRILVAPLYPQYSGASTGTVNDKVFETLSAMRWQPALRTLPPYHDDRHYIDALATSYRHAIALLDFLPEAVVTSFHSMPEATLLKGDPYHCQCQKTARLFGQAVGVSPIVSFQSKLGRAKWLEPPTEATLEGLAQGGTRSVVVIAPGFSADNLETLEEIAIRGRDAFLAAGGTHFAMVPCLNATPTGMALLKTLLARELEGWTSAGYPPAK